MTTWTSGYVADIGYTYGYYNELNPLRLRLALLNAGWVCPEYSSACELGFGQGLSANLHAASSPAVWWGTDFNPAQAGFARDLAIASGSAASLFDDSFAEFCARPEVPEFDYIGLHGIWSWISDQNRVVIVDFIRRKLKVGGVLYISYNTLPGWAAFAPVRHLLTEHAEVLGSEGRGIVSRIDGAIEFAEKLLATNPAFSRANSFVGDRLAKMKEHNRHYLAHEYFNRDWHPMHFATMAEWLEPAKVQFACSANLLDAIDVINLSVEQQSFLADIPDPMFRETTRDFMVNQQFRKDYWVKGARQLSKVEQLDALRLQRLILTTPRSDVALKVTGALGEASLQESVYAPILDLMADYRPRTLAEMESALKVREVNFAQLVQAAVVLCGAGHLSVAQDDVAISRVRKRSLAANQWLMNRARGGNDISYLASPVTGGGVAVNRFQQLFILCLQSGQRKPEEWAQAVWKTISSQGQRIISKGKTLETAEDNLEELTRQAQEFAEKYLPMLKASGVV